MSDVLTAMPPPPVNGTARIIANAPEHISPTAAKSYLTCSLRFYFERVRVIGMIETAVAGIASGRFHPQPGMQCSWCQYRVECLAWAPSVARVGRRGQ